MKFETNYYRLKNGVRVLLIPMEGVESLATLVLVKTGSRNEVDAQAGISHVLEHMLFKGSRKFPTPLAVASAVDALGAQYNAYTGKEYTGYYIHADSRHAKKALEILGEMVVQPLILPAELKREQGVIVEEINMYEDTPMERAEEELENLLYQGSDLGRLIIGSKETVRNTTPETVRAYKDKWYRGGNLLVVLVGNLRNKKLETRNLLEENFGGLPAGDMEDYVSQAMFGQGRSNHLKKKTEQAHFALGWPGYSMKNDKRFAAKVLSNILGGTMSSRLFTEVREKRGLAYYVRAGHDSLFDVGQMVVRAGVRLEKLEEAIEVVKDQTLKLAETVTKKELNLAKDNLRGRMVLGLTDPMDVAQFFGHRTLATDLVTPAEKILKELEEVSLEGVKEVAEELLKESEMRVMVVGPKAK